ncbi:hypothetical protein ZIOFF_050126 [Zingiber officinale]|uniref:Protein kinase domain-containing protein n=1 Tax=Zingiber officinale TaxID=94328 RepID=A0A8J5FID8_ZINOF|nr:hypothetical protein ZIOFF_050126 [Zingiber officinale]
MIGAAQLLAMLSCRCKKANANASPPSFPNRYQRQPKHYQSALLLPIAVEHHHLIDGRLFAPPSERHRLFPTLLLSFAMSPYEYICNKSLHWHLFNEFAELLEWDRRHAIALGIAKDLRPSNVLLTHDFVPMLGYFGLAKWESNSDSFQTQVLGTSGYLAPEYAEFGIVSVRTDVHSFGVLLFQLIPGRPVIDEDNGHSQHILQWAEPLVENLALHDLIDPALGESYDTYELYRVARAAFLCVRINPEMRPSVGEVVHLLEEGHVRDLPQQFVPYYTK